MGSLVPKSCVLHSWLVYRCFDPNLHALASNLHAVHGIAPFGGAGVTAVEGEGIESVNEDDGLSVVLVVVETDARGSIMTAAGCDPDVLDRRCPVKRAFKLCRSFSAPELRAS